MAHYTGPFKKTFNGKSYTKYDFHRYKADAISHAKILRNQNALVIIVKGKSATGLSGYRLYTRTKTNSYDYRV